MLLLNEASHLKLKPAVQEHSLRDMNSIHSVEMFLTCIIISSLLIGYIYICVCVCVCVCVCIQPYRLQPCCKKRLQNILNTKETQDNILKESEGVCITSTLQACLMEGKSLMHKPIEVSLHSFFLIYFSDMDIFKYVNLFTHAMVWHFTSS